METDEQLITRCLDGDQEAFRTLYQRHCPRVRSLLFQLTGKPEGLDDLTQEVFIKVFRALPKFRGESQFSTWIFRITYNVCQDFRRKQGRRLQLVNLPETTSLENLAVPDGREDNLGRLGRQELVQNALATLPAEQRDVIVLHDLQEKPQDEVARILNLPVGTVKSRVFYGRRKLREYLVAQGVEL
ncbi:sigma-70 family RNA polymerase sigma factor [Candidatus Cyanaurora vandensis]|uniref:sigma-70 family RNA polymerase sigma factor n=1 Tax=Candidatus Cyanaurora vandensis TaxID=2714958 RepID=UPI00257A83A9|nr:sigma-70 family RNA polymerase sigma factor [Candidatus Cyanaurora vandensis]